MTTERQQLEMMIVGLEGQRALLGDAVVDAALISLRAKVASLAAAPRNESGIADMLVSGLGVVVPRESLTAFRVFQIMQAYFIL